ncbi:TonB-dependent receptor domain-containing protein [Robiginitomaculum antarcticum]|uniref:TonB-dependent receptor domain-containing protein n=1 Tax=Robiginitomaculum antarcticum TaxID=437507 RepID=UPI00036A3009|nr:TonB-dependent receptor [Robiginitomaculum antarcticum]
MTHLDLKKLLLGTSVLAGFAAVSFAAPVYAQTVDQVEDPIRVETINENDDVREDDEVVVTGSRLKKSTFNSITPLQVIDTDLAADSGLFSPVEILQTSSTASGQQIDSTFSGFVLDNGPGSETVDLRGLGANRTLVLMNSRRLAPAGVEGAPTQVSINLIPETMIDRYEILTDGASSVYGSDAVSGVINVITKTDFDGLELDIRADSPEYGDGQDYTIGASYGKSIDRGFIGGAVEYSYTDPWTLADRKFLQGCDEYQEVTTNGEIRSINLEDTERYTEQGLSYPATSCRDGGSISRQAGYLAPLVASPLSFLFANPAGGNSGVPGFDTFARPFGAALDQDGDGVYDTPLSNLTTNGRQNELQQLQSEQARTSVFFNGQYTFEGEMNITPYFEFLYSQNNIKSRGFQGQLFPEVPGNNPFNPCNPAAAGGQDCGLVYDQLVQTPEYVTQFQAVLNNINLNAFGTDNCFGRGFTAACSPAAFGALNGPAGPIGFQPVVGVLNDRNVNDIQLAQSRLVTGLNGDLPGINFGTFSDWSFDVSGSYSWSDSTSERLGVRGDRLALALGLGIDPVTALSTNQPCDTTGFNITPDVSDGCVPVNMFAPSLYQSPAGNSFASQAETDYLFDKRSFATQTSQLIFDAIVQGDVYQLPGGDVSMLLGAQFRRDDVNSTPNLVASQGLFFGFAGDQGAQGKRDISEVYGELSIPFGTGTVGFREFNVDLAGRVTDDEFYGTNSTYNVKAGYRPIDSLLLRGTIGTSFRAPNLRELFLKRQTGFTNIVDPCVAGGAAFRNITTTIGDPPNFVYDPTLDQRDDAVIANCAAAGLTPDLFGSTQGAVYNSEVLSAGNLDLDPEESDSYTLGFSFEQPFTDKFDLEFGATYYKIEIENTVIEPTASSVLGDCYRRGPTQSAFCNSFTRNPVTAANNPGRVTLVDTIFSNRDLETAEGVDINAVLSKNNINALGKSFDFRSRLQANHLLERNLEDLNDEGLRDVTEFKGSFGYSEWRGSWTNYVDFDRWRLTLSTFFQSEVETREFESDGVTPLRTVAAFTNYNDSNNDAVTCAGPAAGDVNCRPVFFADSYFTHSLSVRYRGDDWNAVVGVSNILNEEPPRIDTREQFGISNTPLGYGYDLEGREYFIRLNKTFR